MEKFNVIKGKFSSKNIKIGLVASCFNQPIVDYLVDGACSIFKQLEGNEDSLTIVRVPGAYEIPLVTKKLLMTGSYDVILACGVLIKGATPHFDLISSHVASSLGALSIEFVKPVIFSVITANTVEEAWLRAGVKGCNLGEEGMLASLEMANVMKAI